jgi:ferredoxin
MAKIIFEGEEKHVPDGENIQQPCEEMGIPFGCTDGLCGVCAVEVEEGCDNLTDLTEAEIEMEMDLEFRLPCQCKIKSGTVKFRI